MVRGHVAASSASFSMARRARRRDHSSLSWTAGTQEPRSWTGFLRSRGFAPPPRVARFLSMSWSKLGWRHDLEVKPNARAPRQGRGRGISGSGGGGVGWSLGARAEDRRPDAHDRRALFDRRLEVVGHAHRQLGEVERRGELGEAAEARAVVLARRGYGHEPTAAHAGEAPDRGHQRRHLVPGDAPLAVL